MTDKEFKRLNRAQLIDIIYQLQIKQKELEDENLQLKEELADKRIRLRQAGNIAEAALSIHDVLQTAQDAAALYLEEIRTMQAEVEEECRQTMKKARQEAAAIVERASKQYAAYDSAVEAILKEYNQEQGE